MLPEGVGFLMAVDGPLAPESIVDLAINGTPIHRFECTPERLEDLALGWMVAEGHLRPGGTGTVCVDLDRRPARLNFAPSDPADLVSVPQDPCRSTTAPPDSSASDRFLPEPEELRRLFEQMFDRARLRAQTGGLHTGGVVVEHRLVLVAEDVSRHCVIDKLIGASLASGIDHRNAMVLLSGRVSAAIARKAVRVGLGAVATMSIPTTLAADVAARGGVTLVGRARSARPFVYDARAER